MAPKSAASDAERTALTAKPTELAELVNAFVAKRFNGVALSLRQIVAFAVRRAAGCGATRSDECSIALGPSALTSTLAILICLAWVSRMNTTHAAETGAIGLARARCSIVVSADTDALAYGAPGPQ